MQVFVKEDNVDFGVSEVGMVCDGVVGVVFDGVFDDVVGAMFDGAMGVYVHHGVCDSFVRVASRSPFHILIGVPSPSSKFLWLLEIDKRWPIKFLVLVLLLWI
jgi:hypothetical protein